MRNERSDASPAGALLVASHVAHRYGRKPVLGDVNLEVAPGELVGIVGENGSGKSTLLKILAGRLAPRSGEIEIHGRVGYCPQEAHVFQSLTVSENFAWFAAAYNLGEWTEAEQALLERYDFARYANTRVNEISGGTRQKLNLCIALLHDPDVLLLDEPTSGFDWETHLHFWEHAEKLREQGKTVVVVSHLLHDRERFDAIHTLLEGCLT